MELAPKVEDAIAVASPRDQLSDARCESPCSPALTDLEAEGGIQRYQESEKLPYRQSADRERTFVDGVLVGFPRNYILPTSIPLP